LTILWPGDALDPGGRKGGGRGKEMGIVGSENFSSMTSLAVLTSLVELTSQAVLKSLAVLTSLIVLASLAMYISLMALPSLA
jgi:hypothetical protein